MTEEAILVVDHDADYLRLFRALAEQAGITAYQARSAEEAWGILVEVRCTVMVINLELPDGNGEILAAMAKKLYPPLQVVPVADEPRLAPPRDSGAFGPNRTLVKPHTAEELRALTMAASSNGVPEAACGGSGVPIKGCVGFGA
ncbi:MAG TPA: response regulator [Geomonas sp.]|nr:response regulator [Geomonas sp.]